MKNKFYQAFNADTLRYDVLNKKTYKVVRAFDKKDEAIMWAAMLNNGETSVSL